MPHSPSRGLLYSAPPTPESNRRESADTEGAGGADDEAPEATDTASAVADD